MHSNALDLGDNLQHAVDDASIYLDNSVTQASHLVGENLAELTVAFDSELNSGILDLRAAVDTVLGPSEDGGGDITGIVDAVEAAANSAGIYATNRDGLNTDCVALYAAVQGLDAAVTTLKADTSVVDAATAESVDSTAYEAARAALIVDLTASPQSPLLPPAPEQSTLDALDDVITVLNDAVDQLRGLPDLVENDYASSISDALTEVENTVQQETDVVLQQIDNLELISDLTNRIKDVSLALTYCFNQHFKFIIRIIRMNA